MIVTITAMWESGAADPWFMQRIWSMSGDTTTHLTSLLRRGVGGEGRGGDSAALPQPPFDGTLKSLRTCFDPSMLSVYG